MPVADMVPSPTAFDDTGRQHMLILVKKYLYSSNFFQILIRVLLID